MRERDKERLIEFLSMKMCGPFRRDGPNPDHPGCVEAAELVEVIESEPTQPGIEASS